MKVLGNCPKENDERGILFGLGLQNVQQQDKLKREQHLTQRFQLTFGLKLEGAACKRFRSKQAKNAITTSRSLLLTVKSSELISQVLKAARKLCTPLKVSRNKESFARQGHKETGNKKERQTRELDCHTRQGGQHDKKAARRDDCQSVRCDSQSMAIVDGQKKH